MDVYSKSKRSEIMSNIRTKRSSPENIVAFLLRQLKIKYRRNVKSLPGKPDFVVPSAKTVIFVHGCFWHNHPNCGRAKLPRTNRAFWKKKVEGNRRRDSRNTRLLRKDGWHVVTVWQCNLRNQERVLKRLERMIQLNIEYRTPNVE